MFCYFPDFYDISAIDIIKIRKIIKHSMGYSLETLDFSHEKNFYSTKITQFLDYTIGQKFRMTGKDFVVLLGNTFFTPQRKLPTVEHERATANRPSILDVGYWKLHGSQPHAQKKTRTGGLPWKRMQPIYLQFCARGWLLDRALRIEQGVPDIPLLWIRGLNTMCSCFDWVASMAFLTNRGGGRRI